MGRKKKNSRKKNQAQNRRRQSESNCNASNGNDLRDVNSSSAPFGLANLGNTCYFNSALQVLSRTPLLVHLLHSKCNERTTWAGVHRDELVKPLPTSNENGTNTEDEASDNEIDIELLTEQQNSSWSSKMPKMSLVAPFELTVAFFEVMKDMQSPRTSTKRVITPNRLRTALGRKSRQFGDREEQDSHELLRTLLDLIRSDEIRRHRSAVYDWLKIPREPCKQHNVDDDTKALVKAHGPSCNFTTVDVLFSGYLLSSITCHECGNTTQIIEQMFDLSVPVSEAKLPHDHVKKQQQQPQQQQQQYSNNCTLNNNTLSKSSPVNCLENESNEAVDSGERSDGENSSTKANVDLDDLDALVSDDVADLADVEDAQDSDDQEGSREDDFSLSDSSKLKNNELHDMKDLMNKLNMESNDSPVPECDTDAHLMSPSLLLQKEVTGNTSPQPQSNQVNGHEHLTLDLANRKCLINWSLRTVAQFTPRKSQSANSPTLEACLSSFTQPELLTGSNKLFCENCTKLAKEKYSKPKSSSCNGNKQQQQKQNAEKQYKVYSNASKHFLIAYPPLILTIHLKRFHVEGYGNVNLRKINRHVDFPLVLDLSPWVSQVYREIGKFMGVKEDSPESTLKYRLYGLVEHSGTLRGGHYTSKIRVDSNSKGKKTLSTDSKYLRMRPFIPPFDTFLKYLDSSAICNNNEGTRNTQAAAASELPLSPTATGQSSSSPTATNCNSNVNANPNNDEVSSSHSSSTPDECNEDNASSQSTSNQSPTTGGNSQWYYCCDSNVRPVTLNEVLSSQAYLLFYERI